MQILNYKLIDKGFVKAKFDLAFFSWLTIKECTHFSKEGHDWISMPQRSFENNEGKTVYVSLVVIEPDANKRMQEKVLAEISKLKQPTLVDEEDLPF